MLNIFSRYRTNLRVEDLDSLLSHHKETTNERGNTHHPYPPGSAYTQRARVVLRIEYLLHLRHVHLLHPAAIHPPRRWLDLSGSAGYALSRLSEDDISPDTSGPNRHSFAVSAPRAASHSRQNDSFPQGGTQGR